MKKSIFNARIKRNDLITEAGIYFRDEDSELIRHLNSIGKKALVGIEREDGIYTILGEQYVYYKTEKGETGEIFIKNFNDILGKNARSKGKRGDFEYVQINDNQTVWLLNIFVMNALWNTILFLEKFLD